MSNTQSAKAIRESMARKIVAAVHAADGDRIAAAYALGLRPAYLEEQIRKLHLERALPAVGRRRAIVRR